MERYNLEQDIAVFCVVAKSFPDGIMEAFDTLNRVDPSVAGRTFYGISHMGSDGKIIYKAAVEESYKGEGQKFGLESLVIPAGEYLTETVTDFRKQPQQIGSAFERLLKEPDLDRNAYCLEWYKNSDDVLCMVKSV